jgi:hypothetical protein
VYTVITAIVGSTGGPGLHAVLGGAAAIVFAGCLLWLVRSLPSPAPA